MGKRAAAIKKMNSRKICKGQSTYNAERVKKAAPDIVRSFFERITRVPETRHAKALKDAAAEMEKAAKAATALEHEAVKAPPGNSLSRMRRNSQAPLPKARLRCPLCAAFLFMVLIDCQLKRM